MTILSKKKAPPAKQEEANEQALISSNHPSPIPLGSLPSHSQINDRSREERRGSPQCWQVSSREDHPHHTYEEFEKDPSTSHKRRHRSSPLRNTRGPKHRDRVSPNSPSHCSSSSSSPVAGPSSETCGYNSGDEYDYSHKAKRTEAQWIEEDKLFEKKMRKRGFLVKKMGEDGACLFRAVADQVYGDQEMHAAVRKNCMDYIALNSDYFSQYVTEDFNTYVNRKRLDCTHGNHIEMQAMSEIYNRRIEVFCYGKDPINIFFGNHKNDNEPIRLSYQRGSHYNSIVDPHKATIGVGLGLPNYQPGLAETTLINDAVRQSEDMHIEQAMLEDKLRATDWEATNEAIEEQVARDSYLQYLRDNEKRQQSLKCETGSSSTEAAKSESSGSPSNAGKSVEPGESSKLASQGSSHNFYSLLPPQMFGLSEWEDAGILAQVLAESQQEYLDNLKKSRSSNVSDNEEGACCQPSTSS